MTKELDEKCKKCKFYQLIEKLPSEVGWWLERYGLPCRIVRRDVKSWIGILIGTRWKLEEIEVYIEEDFKDYRRNMIIFEEKVMKVPVSSILSMDFILKREEVLEKPEAET